MRGYSLLELIVSVGLFSVVMLVVTGAYLTLISLDREARAGNQLSASLSFAIDSMARNIRTGTDFACNANTSSPNCSAGGTSFSFKDSQGLTMTYRLKTDGSIGQCTGTPCTDATAVALTDSNITIDTLRFYVRGVGTTDQVQPQVIFVLKGSAATDAGETSDFSIQTTATQRLIDL